MRFVTSLLVLLSLTSTDSHRLDRTRQGILDAIERQHDGVAAHVNVMGGPEDCPYKEPLTSLAALGKTCFSECKGNDGKTVPGTPGFEFKQELNTFRVSSAEGFVRVDEGGTDPQPWIYPYVYCQYYHSQPFNDKLDPSDPKKVRKLRSPLYNSNNMQAGHIIAASLGGSNGDPFNFMPQTKKSNMRPGAYNAIESMIRDTQKELNQHFNDGKLKAADNKPCTIYIKSSLKYDDSSSYSWWPTGGVYYASLNKACVDGFKVLAVGKNSKAIGVKWLEAGLTVGGVQAYRDGSGKIVLAEGHTMAVGWVNTHNADAKKWLDPAASD